MKLSEKQEIVISNVLAWADDSYEYTDDIIEEFFNHNDKGMKLITPESVELQTGWDCHYGNECEFFETGEKGNPSIGAPAAWIYDYFHPGYYFQSFPQIMIDLLRDCLHGHEVMRREGKLNNETHLWEWNVFKDENKDKFVKKSFIEKRPVWLRACWIHQYLKGNLNQKSCPR